MQAKIEQIKDTIIDNLSISHDPEDGVVLLFTPNMDVKEGHYHIELSEDEAGKLKAFLIKLHEV